VDTPDKSDSRFLGADPCERVDAVGHAKRNFHGMGNCCTYLGRTQPLLRNGVKAKDHQMSQTISDDYTNFIVRQPGNMSKANVHFTWNFDHVLTSVSCAHLNTELFVHEAA
jgi:hypothetical protein